MDADPIRTNRLDLVPLTPRFLEASLLGDRQQAGLLLAASVPEEWTTEARWAQRRLDELREDPTLQPWLSRAMVSRSEATMIGHIGFHTRPGAKYLDELAPGGVELGFTVFEKWRRQGYAREAAQGLMGWAEREHQVTRFVVSISPANVASLALAQALDFRRIGSHLDEEDGPEDIFERRLTPRKPLSRGDIFWLTLDESQGSFPGRPHPHVVIQDDVLNRSRVQTVVVCALTSNLNLASEPGNVLLELGEGNLPKRSVLVVSQVSSVNKTQLGEYIGTLSADRVDQIFDGLRFHQASFFGQR